MKLKRKLISLSLLVSALTSFCAFGSVAKAAVRGGTFEENMKQAEMMFYKDGLQNCKNKPLFGAVAHIGSKRTDVLDPSSINVYVSPTELMRRYPSLKEYLDNDNSVLDYEIEDSNGVVYRTKKPLPYNAAYDYLIVYISSREIPNKNFKIAAGEEYKIRLYDSNGDLVVEDSFKTKEGVFEEIEQIHKKIAHPPKFDGSLCEKVLKKGYEKNNVGSYAEQSEEAVDGDEKVETSVDDILNHAANKFYADGLNKCENNPIFYVEVFEPVGKVRNKAKNKKLFKDNGLAIHFSPTFLREKFSAFKNGFKHVTFEVVDGKKHVCRFTVSDVFAQPYGDCALVYVPDRAESELLNKRKKKVSGYEKIHLDKDFEVASNEKCIVKIYDSTGKLVVKDSCVSALERGDEAFVQCKAIAHPKKFSRDYWRKVVSEIRLGMKKELDKTVNVVLNAMASPKKQVEENVIEFGDTKADDEEVEDYEENMAY